MLLFYHLFIVWISSLARVTNTCKHSWTHWSGLSPQYWGCGLNRRIRTTTTTTTARPGSWGCLFSQCCLLKPCLFGARDCLWLHSVFWQVFLMSLKIPLQQGWAVKWCSGHWLLIGCQSFALWKLLTIIVAPLKPSPLFCITHRYSFQIKESK